MHRRLYANTRQHVAQRGARASARLIEQRIPLAGRFRRGLKQQAPTRSMGWLLLALILAARALSLSAPDGLPTLGARQAPKASTLLTREPWLALRMQLAITLGVGGVQGTTVLVAVGRLGAGNCLEDFALLPITTPLPLVLGRSEESRRVTETELPPSASCVVPKLFAECVTTPSRQAACAATASALRTRAEVLLGACKWVAAVLASTSTSLLARKA